MKKLKCKSCSKVWYIDDRELNNQKGCPFCLSEIAKEIKFDTMDTPAKVVYDAINRYGIDILKNPNKLLGYIMDISPNLKREMKLLSRVLEDYNKEIWELFHTDISNIESFLKDIKIRLIDYDEMSERGANMICDNLSSAVMFYNGKDLPVVMSVEVSDVSAFSEEKPTVSESKNKITYSKADIIDSGKCGDNAEWKILKNNVLIMDGKGAIYNYKYNNDMRTCIRGFPSWLSYTNRIKKVYIENGITSIGTGTFLGCNSLINITIPDSMTSIGKYAFKNCINLTNIIIPDSVTSIGEYAFYNCSSIINITIPAGVTSIGGCAFWNCSSLTNITIPDSVTSIGEYAFYNCSSIINITIPAGVTSIGNSAFYNCSSLKEIRIPAKARKNMNNWNMYWKNGCNANIIYV